MKRPNILFIHVDQMHWEAMSAYGNKHVKTPHMDQLAADGCSFRASYTAMPQCCPARASWYTGRMSSETGIPANGQILLPELPDLGQWLKKHGGYEAVYAGKWHINGRDVGRSFKYIFGSGQGEHSDAGVARACMGFLENYKSDRPFFLNAGFMNPHDCCYTAGASGGVGKFALGEEMEDQLPPLPENFRDDPKHAARTRGWTKTHWRYYRYAYYRLVEMVDAEIGRLYSALRASRFAENTVVIFTSDHGDGLAFHGKISKGYMEEEAWRVPMILIHPGHIEGGSQDTEHLSIGVDVTATICDYANVPALPKMTIGKSLRPLAEGKDVQGWHEYIVGESFLGAGQVGVRDRKHKTIFYCDGPTKVFNLDADPLEMKDLSAHAEGKAVLKRHRDYLRDYLGRVELCTKLPNRTTPAPFNTYLNYYHNLLKGA